MNSATTGAASKGGFFNRPGMGMLGGLAAGFLGAGLLGMLFGGGLFGGLGGISSIIGLLLQVGLIIIVVRLAMSWWQRRNQTASAYAGPANSAYTGPANGPDQNQAHMNQAQRGCGAQPTQRSGLGGFGFGGSSASDKPIEIAPQDYEAFETLLSDVQAAWSNEDVEKLGKLSTPEMVSYFAKDLAENKARNDINKVSGCEAAAGRPRGSLARRRRPTMPASRCASRWSTRRWSVAPTVWSLAAKRRSRRPRSGPSCARAAPIGNSRRSSRRKPCVIEICQAPRIIPRRFFVGPMRVQCQVMISIRERE